MIVDSLDQFVHEMQEHFAGKKVTVTKTNPIEPVIMQVDEVKILPWERVDKRIQKNHPRDSNFLAVVGKDAEKANGQQSRQSRMLIIHIDPETVYDVRTGRMVLLSDHEVVQFQS